MAISMDLIKQLRTETGARIMDCKKALEKAKGDMVSAKQYVEEKGLVRAEKAVNRSTNVGYIASYTHATGEIASLVELLCETDFVAANQEFRQLAQDLAMQVAALAPADKKELLAQDFVKGSGDSVATTIKALSGKIGEKMELTRFVRFAVGEIK